MWTEENLEKKAKLIIENESEWEKKVNNIRWMNKWKKNEKVKLKRILLQLNEWDEKIGCKWAIRWWILF